MMGLDPLQGNPRYTSIRTLAHNGRTLQQLALDRTTGEKVAIKFTPRGWDEGRNKYLLRELLIHQELSACHHPHIVELRDVFLTPSHLAAVSEYVEGEDLQTFLNNTGGRVSEALARFLFQQLVLALDFCHARGKVSRGVKLANTLLALCPGQLPLVKLADFGFSKDTAAHSAPASQVGTALFVPPEVMHNFAGSPYDGALVDVWACGIVLFMLLFGRHPCLRPEDGALSEQQQMLALFTRTAASQFCLLPQEAAAISPGCADLLGHMLKAVPGERYSMAQVQAHPWFKTGLPEGAALMNATILAEAAARPLTLRHAPEALAALVRHGQQLDPQLGGSLHGSSPAAAAAAASSPTAAVDIPASPTNSREGAAGGAAAGAAAGRSSGSSGAAVIGARVASSSAAVRAAVAGNSMEEGCWGAPPPARLLIHSSSSSDKAQGLLYKQQEQQMLRSGQIPPAHFQMSESTSSSHGSFIAQGQQQQQQQQRQQQQRQQQQQEPINLLETIPSVPLEEVPEESPQQGQFNVWLPQQQGLQPPSSTTTSAGAVAGGSQGGGHYSSVSGGCNPQQQQQQQQAQSQSSTLQQQIQQQQAQLQALQLQQQQQQQAAAAAAGGATNGGPRHMSLLNSADLESLLPGLADPAGACAAAPGSDTQNNNNQQQQSPGAAGATQMEQQNSFMLLLQGIDSLPMDGVGSSIDALLNPAANPLLDAPMPQQYEAQQQQLQQQHQQRSPGATPVASAPAGAVSFPSQQQQASQQQQQQDEPIEIPDDYAAFLVDEDDLAAVKKGGVGGRAAAVRSGAGAGVSSVSLDLRQLSDMLMGGSSAALMEGSSWHKLCRDSFSRSRGGAGGGGGAQLSGPAALGGGGGRGDEADTAATTGGGAIACAVDDDEDDLHALLGLRDMSITHDNN